MKVHGMWGMVLVMGLCEVKRGGGGVGGGEGGGGGFREDERCGEEQILRKTMEFDQQ